SGNRLVIPHEKFGVLLKDAFRDLARHSDDGGVVSLLPRFLETGTHGLKAEDPQAFLLGLPVLLELPQQSPLAELLQVGALIRIGDVPAIFGASHERSVVCVELAVLLAGAAGCEFV